MLRISYTWTCDWCKTTAATLEELVPLGWRQADFLETGEAGPSRYVSKDLCPKCWRPADSPSAPQPSKE